MAGRTQIEPAPLPPAPRLITAGTSAFQRTASAQRLDPTANKGPMALPNQRPEHAEAWINFTIPEVYKLVTGAAGLLSQCELYVGFVDERGVERRLREDDGTIVEEFAGAGGEQFVADCEATLDRFVDRNGSQRGLLDGTAMQWDVTGESYMAGWPVDENGDPADDPATAVAERWEALSRQAIDKASGRWVVQLSRETQTKLPKEGVAYRMWRSHPRWPDETRSWLMGAAEPCRDLRVFTAAQRAAGRSGTVADLIFVPSEASPRQVPTVPPPLPGTPTPAGAVDAAGKSLMGDAGAFATFLERIIGDAVLEVLQDAQAGRTVIPPIVAMAAEYIEKIKKVALGRTVDQGLKDLVEQARHRIADTADAESEFLFGLGDTNRWNGAQIADTDYRRSFRPKALAIADAWTMELLWGGLRGLNYKPEQYRAVRVLVDPRGVVAEPDLAELATQGLKLHAVSWRAWRRTAGFNDEDAPDEAEQRLQAELMKAGAPIPGDAPGGSTAPKDTKPVNEGAGAVAGQEPEAPAGRPAEVPARRAAAGRRARLESLPRGQATDRPRDMMAELLLVEQVARARLEEAAESALDATLHRTGAKLRNWSRQASAANGRTDEHARVTAADAKDVARVLGPARVAELAAGKYETDEARRHDLYLAALAALLVSFRRISNDAFRRAAAIIGREFPEAEVAANIARGEEVLAGGMSQWADRTVFDPIGKWPGESTGLRVPTPVLRRAAAAAGGANVEAGYEPTLDAAGGWVFGPTGMDTLAAAASDRGESAQRIGYEWVYGDEPRTSPWEPHLELDGQVLSGPDDEALADGAPDGGPAYPGDHFGCRCDWVPVLNDESGDAG